MDKIQPIIELVSHLFIKDNITFFFAVVGFIGTLATFIGSRKRLELKLHYFGTNSSKKIALAYIQFNNRSNRAILIMDVNLLIDGTPCPCRKMPTIANSVKHNWGKDDSVHDFFVLQMPIQLSGFGGTSGYFVFDVPQEFEEHPSMPQTFQVSTNRGRTLEVSLLPDQEYSR